MQTIDMDVWPRRKHFQFFNRMDYPHINICANVDVTKTLRFIKENDLSVFKCLLYLIVRAANETEALRMRIRNQTVVLHDRVHPSFTVLTENDTFGFAYAEYTIDAPDFLKRVELAILRSKEDIYLEDEAGRDDYLFLSCLPWIHFTSVAHPIDMHPVDSVPRISWGKIDENHGNMPVSLQAHHALVDGIHMSAFFEALQNHLNQPGTIFEKTS